MESRKRYNYHQLAKQLGVPNIILTGIEKKAKMEYPDDDEMFRCHVVKSLNSIAEKYDGDWSKCEIDGNEELPGARGLSPNK